MNGLAQASGLERGLRLFGAVAVCGALSLAAMASTADAKPAGVSAKYRGACSAKPKSRKGKAKAKAKAKKASRNGRSCGSCRVADPTLTSQFLTAQAGTGPIWRDDCTSADPMPLYGGFCGARADGQQDMNTLNVNQIASGRLSMASRGGPGNSPYRQLTVASGDQAWGNRAALGLDDWRTSPVALWHEGQYRMLNTWVRLEQINQTSNWRELFEIKQAQPYPSGLPDDDGVMFEVQQRSGNLYFMSHWHDLWSVPVSAGAWVPISVEGMWSADPAKGWLRFQVGGQTSGKFNGANLLRNAQTGGTVPSFLEMGPYQDSSLPGFSMGFAGLSVYG